jgi:hypothetical protein
MIRTVEKAKSGDKVCSVGVRTGMRYKMTFFKLSKTRRPDSIATGMDWKSLLSKISAAVVMSVKRHLT